MSERRFVIITILLVLVILFCMKSTVISKGNGEHAQENHYYLGLEQEYVRNAKIFLNEQGFENCGVTMTRVTNQDGTREYTVQIHHRKLERMAEEDKTVLRNSLSQTEFGENTCTFLYDL